MKKNNVIIFALKYYIFRRGGPGEKNILTYLTLNIIVGSTPAVQSGEKHGRVA